MKSAVKRKKIVIYAQNCSKMFMIDAKTLKIISTALPLYIIQEIIITTSIDLCMLYIKIFQTISNWKIIVLWYSSGLAHCRQSVMKFLGTSK